MNRFGMWIIAGGLLMDGGVYLKNGPAAALIFAGVCLAFGGVVCGILNAVGTNAIQMEQKKAEALRRAEEGARGRDAGKVN